MSIQHENRIAALERRVAALEAQKRRPPQEVGRAEPLKVEFVPVEPPPNTLIERARRAIKGST